MYLTVVCRKFHNCNATLTQLFRLHNCAGFDDSRVQNEFDGYAALNQSYLDLEMLTSFVLARVKSGSRGSDLTRFLAESKTLREREWDSSTVAQIDARDCVKLVKKHKETLDRLSIIVKSDILLQQICQEVCSQLDQVKLIDVTVLLPWKP